MSALNWHFLGNSVLSWGLAGLSALLCGFGLPLLLRVVTGRLSRLAQKTDNSIDDLLVLLLQRTSRILFVLLAGGAGMSWLDYPSFITTYFEHILFFVVAWQVVLWGNATIGFILDRYQNTKAGGNGASVTTMYGLAFFARILLVIIAILTALDNVGVDVTTLIAGLGIGGVAIAMAVQNILGDVLASVSIIFDKPFVLGDFIVVGDFMGTVEHIGIKTTRLRSLSGEQLVMANSDLLGSRIRNYKRMSERRVLFKLGVTYQTPHEKLQAIPGILRDIIESCEHTRFDRAHFANFGDSALNFEIVYYLVVPDYNAMMDTQQAINLAIVSKFAELQIEFAYPTQTIMLASDEDGDSHGT